MIPQSGQTVHMMNAIDVFRVLWAMHWKEGRNVREMALYTTDDLRRLYQNRPPDGKYLRDGSIDEVQLVAVIRWRIWRENFGYGLLLAVSLIAAVAALIAVYEGRATL